VAAAPGWSLVRPVTLATPTVPGQQNPLSIYLPLETSFHRRSDTAPQDHDRRGNGDDTADDGRSDDRCCAHRQTRPAETSGGSGPRKGRQRRVAAEARAWLRGRTVVRPRRPLWPAPTQRPWQRAAPGSSTGLRSGCDPAVHDVAVPPRRTPRPVVRGRPPCSRGRPATAGGHRGSLSLAGVSPGTRCRVVRDGRTWRGNGRSRPAAPPITLVAAANTVAPNETQFRRSQASHLQDGQP
jgi:hypothetical protein